MKWKLAAMATALAFVMSSGVANAAGELNLFNWGNGQCINLFAA